MIAKRRNWARASIADLTTPSPRSPITPIQDDGGYKSILIYENPGVDLSTVPTNGRESLISAAAEANVHTQTSKKPRYSLFSKVATFFTEEAN